MSHYPYLGPKDRKLAYAAMIYLKSVDAKATNPKIKSSAMSWAMLLREALKAPRPESTPTQQTR